MKKTYTELDCSADNRATNFSHHPPKGNQVSRYEHIRECGLEFSKTLNEQCPRSRELDIATDKLREVVMWANASIACNE